jgi:hypothetical protein
MRIRHTLLELYLIVSPSFRHFVRDILQLDESAYERTRWQISEHLSDMPK